ncbi:hypothetical protein DIURU_002599 [Diutina rugosa]|uniref:Uncharacterized protein n=1 Tax=Diutina rugosa TaxID=5481 RepID=A0A642UPQ7_DIURU|nr:uncharacterized protein DIURU_002599 [Diutina rugosa]KAA8902998.1 hypothetical protein DIURU_002599 [Diutina rugosa]
MEPLSRSGGTRKCFYEFQTLAACYTSAETSSKSQCQPQFDDYFECLHGYKERAQVRSMLKQLDENKAHNHDHKDHKDHTHAVTADELYKKSGRVYENLDLIQKN